MARIVRIPTRDKFGITELVRSTTRYGSELSEVFASHCFVTNSGEKCDTAGARTKAALRKGKTKHVASMSPAGNVVDVLEAFIAKNEEVNRAKP